MAGELVLVIDDSPTITKVVQLVLTKAGYQVQTAADGEQGLVAVREKRPELILLDFVMPRMNGYQFCRELTADPKLRDIPVILMSAKGDQVGERFVKVMGIVDYITKPFSPEAITAVVQHAIGKYAGAGHDEENPSLVTGEDLAATDDADRSHARSAAMGQIRSQVSDVISARVSALFSLAASAGDGEKIVTDAAAIADAVKAALDDGALSRTLGSIDLTLFGEGHAGPARRPTRRSARRGAAAARRPGAIRRAHGRAHRCARRYLLPSRPRRSGDRRWRARRVLARPVRHGMPS